MKRVSIFGVSITALLFLPSSLPAQTTRLAMDPDAVANGWQFNYRDALKRAGSTGKPLMVVLRCVP